MPPSASDEEITVLVFRAGSSTLALRIDADMEVVRLRPATPLPLAPPWIPGFAELRGEAVLIVDLAARLGIREARCDGGGLAVVLSVDDRKVALLVDAVEGVYSVTEKPAVLPAAADESARCYAGLLRCEGQPALLLDARVLLSHEAASSQTVLSHRNEEALV